MSELKKCPFCGGEVYIDREDIFCDVCHLSLKIHDRLMNGEAETYEEAREQAIETWNTRKPVEKVLERLEQLYRYNSEQADIYRDAEDDRYFRDAIERHMDRANCYGVAIRTVRTGGDDFAKEEVE